MKFSPLSSLLLSYSIGTVNARIGSDDLHTPDDSAYLERDLPIPREPYWPPGKKQVAPRIVGGVQVDPKDRYPYQVALTFSSGRQYCGGSLIAPGWVLSAAHCAGNGSRVQIGRWDLSDNTEEYENIEVDYELVHPDYDNSSLDNDFMLLKLKTDSQYPPVSIDNDSQIIYNGADVTTIGWGATSHRGTSSDVLLEVEVNIVGNNECNMDYFGGITENMLCAARPGKDACQGDSGGPLVIRGDSHTEDVLVGIVSWGYGCARPTYPGVYTRVSKGHDWISEYVSFGSGSKYPSLEPSAQPVNPTTLPTDESGPSDDASEPVPSEDTENGSGSDDYYPSEDYYPSGDYYQSDDYYGSDDYLGSDDSFGLDLCNHNEVLLAINIQTDIYGGDTSWRLDIKTRGKYWDLHTRNIGTFQGETIYKKDMCIPKDQCFTFIINDAANDGLCCNHSRGHYSIFLEGEMLKYSIYANTAGHEDTVFGTNGRVC